MSASIPLVECISSCCNAAHSPKYVPVTVGEYISRKINLRFQSHRAA